MFGLGPQITNPNSDVAFQSANQTSLLVSSLSRGDSPMGMRPKLLGAKEPASGTRERMEIHIAYHFPLIGETPLEVSSSFALTIPLYSDDAEHLAYGEKVHCTANTE